MKKRTGFVSNSSSSSFVLKVSEDIPTVFSVAEIMIKHRNRDNIEAGLTPDTDDIIKLKSLTIDPDTNLRFNTCNYETYISKEDDVYLISTCNNHSFYEVLDIFRDRTNHSYYIKYDEDLFDIEFDREYYVLENDIIGTQLGSVEARQYKCSKHDDWGDFWKIGDDVVCIKCNQIATKKTNN